MEDLGSLRWPNCSHSSAYPPEKKCLSFKIARYLLCTDDDTYIEQHGGHGQKHLETTGVFFVFTVYPYKVVSETLLAAKQLELPQVMSCRLLGRRLTCAHKIDPAARTGFWLTCTHKIDSVVHTHTRCLGGVGWG